MSNFDNALKDWYLPRLLSTINVNRVLMTRLERDSGKTDVTGRHARVPVNIRPSQAIGARDDASNSTLPTAQNQTFADLRIGYKYNYGVIRITHPTIMASRNARGAFTRVMSAEMDGMRRDLKNDFNRQLFGWGNGVIGTINMAGDLSGTAMTLDTGHGVKPNMLIDSYTATVDGTQELDSNVVSNVVGNIVTLAVSDTATDGAFIYRENNRDMEAMGLMGIVDSAAATSGIGPFVTTLQNIIRGTYPEWDANVFENSTANTGRAITEDLLDRAILQSQEEDEAEISLMISSATQFRKVGQLMSPDRRYTTTMKLDGGFEAINWSGVPLVWDRDCQIDYNGNDMLFGLDEAELSIYQLADWDFDDTDGNVLHRRTDQAAYDATLFYYGQLGTTDASNHFVIRDLSR